MTQPPPPPITPGQIRVAATTLLEGSGLHMEECRLELIVTNPADPDQGHVCITLDDGFVTWERAVTDYWGHLDGIPGRDHDTRTVPTSKIIQALTGRM
jgi:hypothetical protein